VIASTIRMLLIVPLVNYHVSQEKCPLIFLVFVACRDHEVA